MWSIWKITMAVMMVTHTTQVVDIVCYNGSLTNFKELPLTSIGSFLTTAFLPAGCDLTVMIPGFESLSSNAFSRVLSNLISKSGSNKCYCSLNWNSGITGGFDDVLSDLTNPTEVVKDIINPILDVDPVIFMTSVVNDFFTALKVLNDGGVDLANLHLIGFSEGALVAGLAGQALKDAGVLIRLITGVAPKSIPLKLASLQKGPANLVVCIHTTHGLFSTDSAPCDIDFYVNRGCNVQPGCNSGIFTITSDSCSTERALDLFAEATANPDSLPGWKASSYNAWKQFSGTAPQDEINFMVSKTNSSRHGSFYLCTSSSAPFGKGIQGCSPSSYLCL